MRVMVTGGTGFIGSHTAKALIDASHDVKLLVRSEEKAARVFRSLNCPLPMLVKGDMTHPESVSLCMDECDAVFHSAALVTMDATKGGQMARDNRLGTEIVLTEACRRNVRSIVYVSSVASIYTPGGGPLKPDAPLSESQTPYSKSKIEAEKIARVLLQKGYPIRITYPSAVIGPDDPGLSESNFGIMSFLRKGMPVTSTGFQFIDVRDLAQIHVKLLQGGDGPGIYFTAGVYRPWKEMAELLEKTTGRSLLHFRIPGALFRGFGRIFDVVHRVIPMNLPLSYEAMRFATQWRVVDDSETLQALGIGYRDQEDTLKDTIAWLYQNGLIKRKHAGTAADRR